MREKVLYGIAILATALLARNLYLIFLQLPDEAAQGAIYRIIYFHVPSAITAMLGFLVAGTASAIYIGTKNLRYDAVAAAVELLGAAPLAANVAGFCIGSLLPLTR